MWEKIKLFFYIQWHAENAMVILDEWSKAAGLMQHPHKDSKDRGVMLMSTEERRNLIVRSTEVLPKTKWK